MLITSGVTIGSGVSFITSLAATDPQFNYVTALLHGDGASAGTNNTFLDSSTNNFTVTRNGSTTQGSFTPYGTLWSNYLKTGDKLTAAASSAFDLSGSTWTIEFWMYSLATPTSGNECRLLMAGANGDAAGWDIGYDNNGSIGFYRPYGGGPVGISTPASTIALNTWYHVAFVCNAGSARIYINGTQAAGPVTITLPTSASQTLRIGYDDVGTVNFQYNGYLSNLRIVKGTAVYTAAFTPPTAPLTAITNTSFLSCQSNRFIDNSTNNLTITPTATPSVQVYSPFGTTTQYDPNVNGGSAYFNGSTDYLSLANNAAFQFGTGDFTVELYYYPTALTGAPANFQGIIGMWGGGTGQSSWLLYFNAGNLYWYTSTNGSTQTATLVATSGISINSWYHLAVVRSSGTTTIYVNGTSIGSTATVVNLFAASCTLTIGYNPTGGTPDYVYGYLSNIRIVKGTAVYTTAFTPPTAPVTAIANTSLLLNGTNGQIFDNAMMNNFVTAGSAQISTSIYKYGTGSIYLDGTGDWLVGENNQTIAFGSGNFTVEGWIYLNNVSATKGIIFGRGSNSFGLRVGQGFSGNVNGLNIVRSGVADLEYCSYTFATSTWYHIAVVRSGTTIYFFVNGTQQTTLGSGGGSYTFANPTSGFYIGCNNDTNEPFAGYIDEFRITNGIARYTSNFTAPTSAFPNTGPIPTYPSTVEYLVVAGGGGGGYADGGGGGAGGYRTATGFSVSPSTPYTVTVGAGGAGVGTSGAQAGNGLDSVFSSITSIGGGGGGTGSAGPYPGQNGGSGGGSSNNSATQGIGTVGQGTNGGAALTSSPYYPASGGGGAGFGGLGGGGSVAGNGGIGLQSSISGTATYYAGGGGGGVQPGGTVGTGGAGGGGAGGSSANGISGTINTGGGGGGGGNSTGGTGGSGIVIIRYADTYPLATSTTGSPTVITAGGYNIYIWTSSGSITF